MGRVGNFIDALTARNLRETEDILRVAMGAASPEELEEIKSKVKTKPYNDLEVTNEYIIREFDENIWQIFPHNGTGPAIRKAARKDC